MQKEESRNSDQNYPTKFDSENSSDLSNVSHFCNANNANKVLLATAVVNVYNDQFEIVPCRALLDCGSQMNFATERLVKRLGISTCNSNVVISGVGRELVQSHSSVNHHVKSRVNDFNAKINCVVLSNITQKLPQHFVSLDAIKIPEGLTLADPNFNVPDDIDMLIGTDLFWKAICARQIKSQASGPTLQKTQFGWVISGQIQISLVS